MATIESLRVQLESEYLEPVMEETPRVPLTTAINASELDLNYDPDILSPDELSYFGPGRVIELENELMRIEAIDQNTRTLTVRREILGTTGAAHAAGVDIRIPTRWTRHAQIRALRAATNALWQPLFIALEEQATVSSAGYITLPLTTIRVIALDVQNSNGKWVAAPGKLLQRHPLNPDYAAVQVEKVPKNANLALLRYAVRIEAPTADTDEIENLPEAWERIILVDAAANLLASVDIDAYTQEILTEQLRLEGFPVTSGARISQNLLRYREYLVDNARRTLVAENPKKVRHNRVTAWK